MCCSLCAGEIVRTKEAIRLVFRGTRLFVQGVERDRCTKCGEEFFNVTEAAKLEAETRKQYRAKTSLTGAQVARIRRKLGLSQAELEKTLGLGEKVVVRWENGKVRLPGPVNALLKILDKKPSVIKFA